MLLGGLAVLSLLPAIKVQRELVRAKSAIEAGRDAFFGGDLPLARHRFDEAAASFIRARSRVDTPLLNLASAVPIVGRTPDSIEAMAIAGANVAGAGSELAFAVSRLRGGLGALAPARGRIRLEALEALRPVLRSVTETVEAAGEQLSATERAWVLPQVADARRQFEVPLRTLDSALRAASAVAARLPRFLGADGPRHYFVAAQNPAELRGTGGFIGSFSILTADRGRLRFTPFRTIETLPDAIGRIRPPNADYAARYDGFGGAGFWRNINMTPDFPSAAVAIERLFRTVTRVPIDGVIAADPHALGALLGATGPVRVPALGTTLNAGNVVEFTTNRAYSLITDRERRKRVLGDAARAVFDRFIAGTPTPGAAVRALAESVAGGHLLLHAVDENVQEAFVAARAAGALQAPPSDFVAVSASNAGANKLDFYVRRTVRYEVGLNPDGSATSTLTVTLANPAPVAGQPAYVIGPYPGASGKGESVSFVSAYCPETCELERHTINGRPEPVGVGRELGHRVFSEFVRVAAGDRSTLGYELALPNAWLGDDLSGRYRLTVQEQPGQVHPTALTVVVRTPPGTRVAFTNPPMALDGDTATWSGPAGKLQEIEVAFERPLLPRAWARFVRFLVKPLF